MVSLPYENALRPKSIVSPSLLAQIITDKYNLFLPLYRQEHDPGRFGFPLSRQTMSNWIIYACHELLVSVARSCECILSKRQIARLEFYQILWRIEKTHKTKSFFKEVYRNGQKYS